MWKKIIPGILVVTLLLSACGNSATTDVKDNSESETNVTEETDKTGEAVPYLSITETHYIDDKEEKMESRVITYDGKEIREVGHVPYDSDYPLTCYVKSEDSIYYTGDAGPRYQIYKNGTTPYQCALDFCQYNYLNRCGDKFFCLARHNRTHGMVPILLDKDIKDKEYKQLIEDPEDDLICWTAGTDYEKHNIYFSSYSDDEDRKTMDSETKTCKTTIHCYNLDTQEIKNVFEKKLYVSSIAAKDGILYMLVDSTWRLKNKKIMILNTNTGEMKESDIKLKIRGEGDMEIIGDKLYYIGTEFGYAGIYSYDLTSEEKELVLKQNENEFINGFTLNY